MSPRRPLILTAAGVVAAALLAGAVGRADDRRPVPPDAEIEKAQETVRELFKAEFAKTKSADRFALAAKLYRQAVETTDDPASRFALFREARDLAARAADAAGAFRAGDAMAAHFAVRPGEALVPALDLLVAASISPAQVKANAEVLLVAADEARFGGDVESAQAILKAAAALANRVNVASLAERVRTKIKDADAQRAEADRVKGDLTTLKTNPTDPAANLAVGRYYAFFLQDWAAGIPLLAKGADEKLRAAAGLDLKAASGTDEAQIAAADIWYDLAATADPGVKGAIQVRAHHWYATAFGAQTGLTRTRVEKRIAELQSVAASKADRSKMWAVVRRGVAEEKLKKWNVIGGGFADTAFEEMPPGGGILIGFQYTTTRRGEFPGAVQPIYLTPAGEVMGAVYGAGVRPDGKGMTTKAKPGYAVGAIYVRGGGGFDAFKPIYMRMTDTGVNPKDSYDGPYIGGKGGGEGTVGGDGNFIVGLHGKVFDRGTDKGRMAAMSAITLTDSPAGRPFPKRKRP